jgi:hypothetical protein
VAQPEPRFLPLRVVPARRTCSAVVPRWSLAARKTPISRSVRSLHGPSRAGRPCGVRMDRRFEDGEEGEGRGPVQIPVIYGVTDQRFRVRLPAVTADPRERIRRAVDAAVRARLACCRVCDVRLIELARPRREAEPAAGALQLSLSQPGAQEARPEPPGRRGSQAQLRGVRPAARDEGQSQGPLLLAEVLQRGARRRHRQRLLSRNSPTRRASLFLPRPDTAQRVAEFLLVRVGARGRDRSRSSQVRETPVLPFQAIPLARRGVR